MDSSPVKDKDSISSAECYDPGQFLTAMIEIGREAASILSLDELMEKIAERTRELIDFQIFAILLVDETSKDLYFRFTQGYPEGTVGNRIPFGEGLVGEAASRRQPVLVTDVSKDARYIDVVKGVRSELAIPLISRNRVVGVLDIESRQPNYFKTYHQDILTLLASQLAVAVDNANLYESLVTRSEMLETLHDIGKEVTSILDLEQLLKRVAELLRRVFHYHVFSIFLVDEEEQVLKARLSIKFNRGAVEKVRVPLGKGLVGTAVSRMKPLLINDVSKDPRYIRMIPDTCSEMVVPLIYKDKAIGAFDLQSPELNYFTPFHEQALVTLASHVAVAIENARLYERVVAAEAMLDRELKIAREIQYSLIPDKFPEIQGATFAAEYRPARILGGDLYDFYWSDENSVAMAIGDVSGKGAPAALLGALTSGILRTRAGRKYAPAEMLRLVNHSLRQRVIEGRFMTLCYAIYEAKSHCLKYSNSGAPAPIHCKDGQGEILHVEGFPLGMFDNSEYKEEEVILQPGSTVLFYTDGLTEARDMRGEEFGTVRLKEVLENNCHLEPGKIIEKIFDQLEKFCVDSRKFDDQTILVLKVNA